MGLLRTLEEALAFARVDTGADELLRRRADAKAIEAIRDRIGLRGPDIGAVQEFTYGECLVHEISAMSAEIFNGGFDQYLFNSTSDTAEATKQYLQDIGALDTLELLRKATSIFPGGIAPQDRSVRWELMEQFEAENPESEFLSELDEAFYHPDPKLRGFEREPLDGLMIQYIERHRDDFVLPTDEMVAAFRQPTPKAYDEQEALEAHQYHAELFREQGDAIPPSFINRCPKCSKIARTPKAKQCPWCFHDWH